jgi:ABC-type branched-subunit amino acid transport system ATPase component
VTARLDVVGLKAAIAGQNVLDIDRFSAEAGDLLVIVGGSGSGKSVLAAALAGDLATEGRVLIDGVALQGSPSRHRRQGLSAAVRDGERLAGCTVLEALRLATSRRSRVDAALERFPQLATRERLLVQLLSGGEQQLLRIACAWCAQPRVLVLDSPTAGLAGDAIDAVKSLAGAEVARGCAVLWLDQDERHVPVPPRLRLVRGRVAAVTAGESAPAPD